MQHRDKRVPQSKDSAKAPAALDKIDGWPPRYS